MFLFINQIKLAYIVEIFALLILNATTKKRQEKKKFVRTPRVKRQFLTFLFIIIAVFIVGNIFKEKATFILVAILSVLAYVLVLCVNIIN